MTRTLFCPHCCRDQPATKMYLENRNGGFSSRRVWMCLACKERLFVPSKFRNKPTASKHTLGPAGKPRMFHSKLEADREPTLLALQNVGHISQLRYQVPFSLEVYGTGAVEALLEAIAELDLSLMVRLRAQDVRRSRQHVCSYRADYVYFNDKGRLVCEDTKGPVTAVYRIKKRLMAACCNIEIQEPKPGGIQQRARGADISGRGTGSRLSGNGRQR